MFEVIYESDEWVVCRDENGELEITNLLDWNGAIHITKDSIWEE